MSRMHDGEFVQIGISQLELLISSFDMLDEVTCATVEAEKRAKLVIYKRPGITVIQKRKPWQKLQNAKKKWHACDQTAQRCSPLWQAQQE